MGKYIETLCPLRVKGHIVSIHNHIHNLYGPYQAQKSIWNIYGFETYFIHCLMSKEKIRAYSNLKVVSKIQRMCVFASKGTHVAYFNLNLQYHQHIQLIWKVHLSWFLYRVKFDTSPNNEDLELKRAFLCMERTSVGLSDIWGFKCWGCSIMKKWGHSLEKVGLVWASVMRIGYTICNGKSVGLRMD